MGITELMASYLMHLESLNYSPNTVLIRQREVRAFLSTMHVNTTAAILPQTLTTYQAHLRGRQLADNTRIVKLVSVRSFLQYLRTKGCILFNADILLTIPKSGRTLPRAILTEEEMKALLHLPILNNPRAARLRAIVELLYGTGIRRAELLKLDLYDLDMPRRTLLIREGKGGKDRLLPIPKTVRRWVTRYITGRRAYTCKHYQTSRALFVDLTNGTRLENSELDMSMRRLRNAARDELGIEKPITCHTFRHSIATHLLQHGVDIRYIQELLGHAQLSTTQIYTRIATVHAGKELRRCHPREKMKVPLHS